MIQELSKRFRQPIAVFFLLMFYMQLIMPLHSMAAGTDRYTSGYHNRSWNRNFVISARKIQKNKFPVQQITPVYKTIGIREEKVEIEKKSQVLNSAYKIGGPSSPEASSFQPVGSDNLVNLFTGDFSYSIPLLDVGGYPVNLFYNGGISMEQEASWVGLGWNINPGSVSRNMRGVPDDFDGTDMLTQIQNVKPNKTWGGEIGVDGEVLGIKKPNLNFNLGFSYNNYLGPELEMGAGISVSIPITKTEMHEKSAPLDSSQGLNLDLGASAKLSTRSGLTLLPSLNARLHSVDQGTNLGVGLSTSYNSRTGIKDLTISSQTSLFNSSERGKNEKGETQYDKNRISPVLTSSTISFARPSYLPTLRMPMQYSNYSGQIELGAGMFGLRGAATAQGYYSISRVASTTISKPLVGFMYLEKANGRKDAVMDFNRLNDGEVTPNTPVISAPQYDYDIFTIQGEGTGGSIRAYRGDLGFMRDNETTSKDNNFSIGFDVAPAGHYGGNWNIVSAPTRSGGWDDANNTLTQTLTFNGAPNNSSFENVYFRNPGEATVANEEMINKIGKDNIVRFKIDGSAVTPRLQSQLEQFSKSTGSSLGTISVAKANTSQQRDKRTQVVTMLTADDTRKIGLDTVLKSYLPTLDASSTLQYTSIQRVGGYRKGNHISEIDVLEQSGMRYVYGLPVYSTVQTDFTFSVVGTGNTNTNLVNYNSDEPTVNSRSINNNTGIDGYVNIQQTPAYASSFLITGLLSPDYVDVTGNGITEDDLGNAVKFNYTMSLDVHKWCTPRENTNGNVAHFNSGLKTERRDNKATISYGEREAWYLHSIESKSMIAIFKTSRRNDAKGVNGVSGKIGSADSKIDSKINSTENANVKLDSILLYTKADIKANGLAGAVPLKTVHFDYNYSLCKGTPDNPNGGKLTLVDIYFTFNGQGRASKNMYVFNYGDTTSKADDPGYAYNASDRWSTYKPVIDPISGNAVNPNGLSNIDYPYTSANKSIDDIYAGAWSLKKILLPSGGQIEVQYEADDYAYVQNRRACNMINIYGLGNSTDYSRGNMLYSVFQQQDQNYVYVQLPAALQNTDPVKVKQEIYAKYLDGINQLAFRLNVNMPKGMEPLTVYTSYDDYGLCTNSATKTPVIYIKLRPVNGKGPLANAAVQFLINNLPGQAFPGYDLSDDTKIDVFFKLIALELSTFVNAFKNAEGQVRSAGGGSSISLANSFIRLNSPAFFKYGGGHRVKRVLLKDNWNAMSGQYTSQYGQDYDYTTTTIVNGIPTTISSGVASYEPGIGSEENPFREILQFQDKLPLASAQYGAIEMPVLEALYPSPVVGYSKVTVRSINRNGTQGNSIVRSAIGKQVTEFYTAKDYPTFSAYTPMNNMDYHSSTPFSFLYKETIDRRTTSQGFLVETNDMHGKLRSQAAYSESDNNTPLSYTYHTYKNTGVNGLNDKVDFVRNDQGGAVVSGNMGVDAELMTDVREFSVSSNGLNGQIQTEFFTFFPWPIFGIFNYPLKSYTENKYRAVTTTKLINFHAIEDSVIVNDKGSIISTKTIAYDAETGAPVVARTANEFNDPVYNISYPAYWAYSGVAPAYKNIGVQFSNVNFSNGKIISGVNDQRIFESGDELYVTNITGPAPTCPQASSNVTRLWAFDTNKNNTALTVPSANRNIVFLDTAGNLFTQNGVSFKIVRSGKRNNVDLTVSTVTAMQNPIQTINGVRQLVVNNSNNVVAATAVAYKEKWQVDNDVVPTTSFITINCERKEILDCNGLLPKHINPYLKGLVGNYKPYRSYTYYGARNETDPSVNTNIRSNGYISGFSNYWAFDNNSNLVPDNTNSNWVWNSELTKVNAKGMELETKDALEIYTSAQYGYQKSFPISITKNAKQQEAFYDGFEDNEYNESLNGVQRNMCAPKFIDLTSGDKSVVKAADENIQAHSGKYVLKVVGSSPKEFSVTSSDLSSFNLSFGSDTQKAYTNIGYDIDETDQNYKYYPIGLFSANSAYQNAKSYFESKTTFNNSGFNIANIDLVNENQSYNDGTRISYSYNVPFSYYITVPETGVYSLKMDASTQLLFSPDPNQPYQYNCSLEEDVSILNTDGEEILTIQRTPAPTLATNVISTSFTNPNVQLCKGVYQVKGYMIFGYFTQTAYRYATNQSFSLSLTNGVSGLKCYKKDYVPTCPYTTPIKGETNMLNPIFTIPAGKKMLFSAWVKEKCGNPQNGVPCVLTTYSNNKVQIADENGTVIKELVPAGPIIEGWQRYEGDFTVPQGSKALLYFINSSGNPIYFDDIRIHPFNANMKSYVYDPRILRLSAELDENNYASFYDYDEEGQLIRVKKETVQGIKTIQETRSAKQKAVTTVK